jgi:hypothetical protein
MFGRSGETPSARFTLSPDFASFLSGQRTLPIAHIAKALTQRLQVFERSVVDSWMMTSENDFVLVVTENAALEFAWNCHAVSSRSLLPPEPREADRH